MKITTPRSWPEAQMPTAEQYRTWFLACTEAEQLHLAERTLDDAHRATACLLANHDRLLDELRSAYDLAGRLASQVMRHPMPLPIDGHAYHRRTRNRKGRRR